MAVFNMLGHVKKCLGITDEYHDDILQAYIDDVGFYLQDAGIPEDIVTSAKCGGIVARGVSDLWNYGSGGAELSPFFHERAAQLALKYSGVPLTPDEACERIARISSEMGVANG